MLDLIKSNMMAINMKSFVETLTDLSNNAKSDIQPNVQK
jgi:hypothetical protein